MNFALNLQKTCLQIGLDDNVAAFYSTPLRVDPMLHKKGILHFDQ